MYSVNFTPTLSVKLWGRKFINMALNDKTNLLVQKYIRRQFPELEEGLRATSTTSYNALNSRPLHLQTPRSKFQTTHHQRRRRAWSATQCHRGRPIWQLLQWPCHLLRQRLGPSLNSQQQHHDIADGRKSETFS